MDHLFINPIIKGQVIVRRLLTCSLLILWLLLPLLSNSQTGVTSLWNLTATVDLDGVFLVIADAEIVTGNSTFTSTVTTKTISGATEVYTIPFSGTYNNGNYTVTNQHFDAVPGEDATLISLTFTISGNTLTGSGNISIIIPGVGTRPGTVQLTGTKVLREKPTVSTGEILDLKTDSVLVLGNVFSDGGLAVTQRGIVYSLSDGPVIGSATAIADTLDGTGGFGVVIPGLLLNTTYYVRAYATNQEGTAYGETHRFTTPVNITNVAVGSLPQNLAINRKSNKVYEANNLGNSVSVIDGKTGLIDTTILVGKAPYYVGVNERTNKIYIPNNTGNSVSVINGATNAIDAIIAVGTAPRAAVVNDVTNKIYVPADYTANPGKVYVIDGITNAVESTITVGQRPIAAAINKVTNKIYVANNWGNSVTVIDGATGNSETVAAGNSPRYVTVNNLTNRVYVVNYRDSSVTVIDGKTNQTNTIRLVKNAFPWAAAVNRITNKIYVSNSGTNTVTVINGETNAIKNIGVGNSPQAIAVNEATNRIYVGNYNFDERSNVGYIITEIDGTTDKIVGFACVKNPAELAINGKKNETFVINGDQVKSIKEFEPSISVSSNSLQLASSGGSTTFSVSSNITWRITPGQPWLTLSDTIGTGNKVVTISVPANTSSSERKATATIFMGYDADTLSVQITQQGAASLIVSPNALSVASAEGSTATFTVTSNTSWTVASDQSWLSANQVSGTGNSTLTVTAQANTTALARTATVTVSGTSVASQTVTVTQLAGAATLSVSTNTLNVASANGSTASFNITSNINWTVVSDQNWLSVNPASGTGNGTITVTALANPSAVIRTATITVSGTGVASQTVTVTQTAGVATLSVSPSILDIEAATGSTATFSVISNTNWTVTPDQTWLTANPASGAGNATVTLTTEANPTASIRTATVTISGTGVTSQTVTVTQLAGVATLSVSPAELNLEATEGSTSTFGIVSNTSWTATSDQTWLVVNPASGTGEGTVTVTAAANPNSIKRTANVIVAATGTTSQTVVVTQYGKVSVLANELANVKVYPNPFNDGIYVNPDHWNTIVIVYDIRRRKILSRVISETEYIPLDEMDKGMYLLELINSSSTVIKKIIKR
jgi:YVTN family beta-propeller protein